jgi:tRNA (cmo5U34)-methyltransferase
VVDDLAEDRLFDGATLIGVLHHLPGREAKLEILQAIACRLTLGAPFVLACNRGRYRERPEFLATWANRWRMAGTPNDEIEAKIGKILQGADPPASNDEVAELLSTAGFGAPELFFSSLFWGGWITRRKESAS